MLIWRGNVRGRPNSRLGSAPPIFFEGISFPSPFRFSWGWLQFLSRPPGIRGIFLPLTQRRTFSGSSSCRTASSCPRFPLSLMGDPPWALLLTIISLPYTSMFHSCSSTPLVGDEGDVDSVLFSYRNFVVAYICAPEAEECMPNYGIDQPVDFRQRVFIFWVGLAQVCDIHADSPRPT